AFELDAAIGRAGKEQVNDPKDVAVVVRGHQPQPKTVAQQFLCHIEEPVARQPVAHEVARHGAAPTTPAAGVKGPVSGRALIPRATDAPPPSSSVAAIVLGTAISGPSVAPPSRMRPPLRASAAKAIAISSMPTPSTQPSLASASDRAIDI